MMKVNNIKLVAAVSALAILIAGGFYWYIVLKEKEPINIVVINSCSSINPQRLELNNGEEVIFKNKDKIDHRLTVGGRTVNIRAGKYTVLKTDFHYGDGAGTYVYDCDASMNIARIQINSVRQASKEQTFEEMYALLPKETQDCVKNSLADNFEKAYKGGGFIIDSKSQDKMNSCFKVSQ